MLRKLLKHEFKSNYIMYLAACAIFIVSCVIAKQLFKIPHPLTMISGFSFVFVPLIMIIALLIANVVKSLWKNMFGKYGQLTLTIPVSTEKLIFSKIIANATWVIIAAIAVMGGIMVLLYGIDIGSVTVQNLFLLILIVSLYLIVYLIFCILFVFTIVTIANCGIIKKHRGLFAILVIYFSSGIVEVIRAIGIIVPVGLIVDGEAWWIGYNHYNIFNGYTGTPYGATIIGAFDFFIFAAGSVGLFFLIRMLLKKKLSYTIG